MTYDFHAHIWPCADHGSRSEEDTEAQLAILRASGVKQVVATPHFYPDNWHSAADFLAFRREREAMLRPLLAKTDLSVYAGAEVLLSEGIDRMEELRELCIAGTSVLLLEMPFVRWNERLYKTVARITCSGICVLLAHIDRYPLEDVKRLFALGAVGQINCEAFAHPLRRRAYRALVRDGFVCALGSDIHLPHDFRAKNIERARLYLGEELMEKLHAWGDAVLSSAYRIEP